MHLEFRFPVAVGWTHYSYISDPISLRAGQVHHENANRGDVFGRLKV